MPEGPLGLFGKTKRGFALCVRAIWALGDSVLIAHAIQALGLASFASNTASALIIVVRWPKADSLVYFAIATSIGTTLLFGLASYLKARSLEKLVFKYTDSNRLFRSLAKSHAETDKKLFDRFRRFMLEEETRLNVVNGAISDIGDDIEATLDDVCDILGVFTGDTCAACVKTIVSLNPGAQDIREAELETEYRDKVSGSDPDRNDNGRYKVWENDATDKIIRLKQPFWGSDNLKKLGPSYRTARTDFGKWYDATLGVGIPYIGLKNDNIPYCGVLLVDNMEGGLQERANKEFLAEVSWRIAVMLYRLRKLKTDIDEFTSATPL